MYEKGDNGHLVKMDEHDQMIMMALTSITTSGLLPLRLHLIWQIGGIILTMPKIPSHDTHS